MGRKGFLEAGDGVKEIYLVIVWRWSEWFGSFVEGGAV